MCELSVKNKFITLLEVTIMVKDIYRGNTQIMIENQANDNSISLGETPLQEVDSIHFSCSSVNTDCGGKGGRGAAHR